MRLADLLVDSWAAVPLEAADLGDALRSILMLAHADGALEESGAVELSAELAAGRRGEVIRVNQDVVIVVGTLEDLPDPKIGLGVSRDPFPVTGQERAGQGEARAVVLLLAPRTLTGTQQQIVPAVAKALRDRRRTERLLAARSVADIRGMKELMGTEFRAKPLVEDALVPATYRVYPDTPLPEVVDLMVRRGVRAVPVVGERYEVLGILTAGDALGHLLKRGRQGEGDEPADLGTASARDVMTRTVLCVSEDQALVEAANMLVNRDVEQLPVVREGEFIGFVTRDTVLRALFGEPPVGPRDDTDRDEDS